MNDMVHFLFSHVLSKTIIEEDEKPVTENEHTYICLNFEQWRTSYQRNIANYSCIGRNGETLSKSLISTAFV